MSLPVTIPLRPSRRLALLLGMAHLAALAVAWPVALALPFKLLLATGIAASALYWLWRVRSPEVAALHLGRAGQIEVETKVGAREAATVLPQSTVLPGLVVLLLRRDGRRCALALPLPTDASGPQAHRRLRLWLKWQAGPA